MEFRVYYSNKDTTSPIVRTEDGGKAKNAIGHGIPSCFLDKVREAAIQIIQFFELPVVEKQKYYREISGGREGYGDDVIISGKQVLDWSYRLILQKVVLLVHEYATKCKQDSTFIPRCSKADQVLGVTAHIDRSGIRVLLQDKEVEGLQVLVDGKWVTVPTLCHRPLLLILVIKCRVMKLAVTLLNEPDPDTEISPVEKLIDETRPRSYKNVKNYGNIK
ncbi:protein SRG1-like [Rosa rugosa]|uniref:protein SRG1-like n=1 Tax=Rosa rugosa TaxID=74645 RepID=UPI002B403017|nr:protein SRG1-like [Rosa rugosa]